MNDPEMVLINAGIVPERMEFLCSGNENCSYCMEDKRKEDVRPKGYIRKERWYEKYYQPVGNRT